MFLWQGRKVLVFFDSLKLWNLSAVDTRNAQPSLNYRMKSQSYPAMKKIKWGRKRAVTEMSTEGSGEEKSLALFGSFCYGVGAWSEYEKVFLRWGNFTAGFSTTTLAVHMLQMSRSKLIADSWREKFPRSWQIYSFFTIKIKSKKLVSIVVGLVVSINHAN